MRQLCYFSLLYSIGPPHITEAPTNQTRVTGETVVLPCTVIGAYNPVVTWQHNGEEIVNDERHHMVDGSLTVTDVDPADGGLYVCTATNTEGAVSANAYVSITGKHYFLYLSQRRVVSFYTCLFSYCYALWWKRCKEGGIL